MVLAEPVGELLSLVRKGDRPTDGDRRAAQLLRRRFGLALPPPFAPGLGPDTPVRPAIAADGPAVAAVRWRSYRVAYRGVLPDPFLDDLEILPPASFWTGRAAVPPSDRHRLVVLGPTGQVHGFCDVGPTRDHDLDPAITGEVNWLYVDPTATGSGLGRRLIAAGVEYLRDRGLTELRLWVLAGNIRGRRFYEAGGWEPDGATRSWPAGEVAVEEQRFRHR